MKSMVWMQEVTLAWKELWPLTFSPGSVLYQCTRIQKAAVFSNDKAASNLCLQSSRRPQD
jgi:hypothetical protein